MPPISEAKVDELEAALRKKVDSMTGYAEANAASRKLEQVFKYFDTNNSGTIDFDEFFAAMVRLNFVGVQRELEALFDRYDENCDGVLDYKEFAQHILGIGEHVVLDLAGKSILERIKARILDCGGANGIRTLTTMLRRVDGNKNNKLERDELVEGFRKYGIELDESVDNEVDRVMAYFDVDNDGHISLTEFLRGIRGTMGKRRKDLVREAFRRLDRTGDGQVTVEDLVLAYNASAHPEVMKGRMSPEEAVKELLNVYESGKSKDGVVTWYEFLCYYRDLSAGIHDDEYFELMMRNAWHISGGQGAAANSSCIRVLVIHTDGAQEVVEVKDSLGVDRSNTKMVLERLSAQGVRDVAKISLS